MFVSDKSFEAGLLWLERQVALKQAQLRGFFTYADLTAAADAGLLPPLARGLGAAAAALALTYLTSFVTLLTSTLLVSHAWLPALHYVASRPSLSPLTPLASHTPLDDLNTNIITNSLQPELTPYTNNATLNQSTLDILSEESVPDNFKCCTKWTKYQDSTTTKRNWYDAIVVYDWKSLEPWWSTTSVLNWLYQSSLVNPMQRWLDKLGEFADLVSREPGSGSELACAAGLAGARGGAPGCVRQWLNLSKLGALVGSVSDR